VKPGVAAPPASTGPSDAPAHRLAPLAAAASGVLVGSGIVATRSVVEQAGPVSLALLRYAIGFACLVVPVALAGWPRVDERLLVEETVTCVLQVAGRVRSRLAVSPDIGEDELRAAALADPGVRRALAGRPVRTVVVRAPRLVNVVPG
jgi:hypothetical protein